MIQLQTITINQTIVHTGNTSTFFSYDTPIVSKVNGEVILHPDWNYNKTTNKYRGQFLGEGIAETRAKLLSGKYSLKEYRETEIK